MSKNTDIHHEQQGWHGPGPPPGPCAPYPPPWAGQAPAGWGCPGTPQPQAAAPEEESVGKSQEENRAEYRNPPEWDPRYDSGQYGGYGWWYGQPWSWGHRAPSYGPAPQWGASPWGWRYANDWQAPQHDAHGSYYRGYPGSEHSRPYGGYPGYEYPGQSWAYSGHERPYSNWGYPGHYGYQGYPGHQSGTHGWQWAQRHAYRATPESACAMFGPWWASWQDPFYRYGWQGPGAYSSWWPYGPSRTWGFGAAA